MSIPKELYPTEDDLPYEEEILRNPFSLKQWWRYLVARADAPFTKRRVLYERALQALPGSYKIWHAYLLNAGFSLESSNQPLPIPSSKQHFRESACYNAQNAMALDHVLGEFNSTEACYTNYMHFDTSLRALPITQHDRIWEHYLMFVSQRGIPIETSLRVCRRYLKYNPSHIDDLLEFLLNYELFQEAEKRLAGVLNDDRFSSIKGKTKHRL